MVPLAAGYVAAMSNEQQANEPERLALSAAEVARRLGISERHLWALHSSARLPQPIRFGRAVRWGADELRQWIAAGAPERSRWELSRQGAGTVGGKQ